MANSYEIDRDDPGYQRHCIIPACPAAFNILDLMEGTPEAEHGWFHSPRIFTGYLRPVHGPVGREHNPRWVRPGDGDEVTGCECPCGRWMWLPGIHQTMGAFKERWAAHIGTETERQKITTEVTT